MEADGAVLVPPVPPPPPPLPLAPAALPLSPVSFHPQAIKDGKDERQLQGFWSQPGDAQMGYTIPNLLTEYAIRNTHVPVGPWRGVNTNQNGVYLECFIEELARAAGKDSLEFRRALMKNHPKHLAVLNAAAEKGDWGKPLPPGVLRGIAQFMGYGSYSAATAEVSEPPRPRVVMLPNSSMP